LFVIGLVGVLVALSVLILMPVLSSIAHDLNASDFEVSMAVSGFTLVSGTFQLFTGPYSDKHGRRRLVLVGTFVHFIMSISCALAWNIWVLIAMRVIQGMANSTMMIVSTGIVSDIYPPVSIIHPASHSHMPHAIDCLLDCLID
jgi:MFS transporter, DHA1 family, multidrug resistance protein